MGERILDAGGKYVSQNVHIWNYSKFINRIWYLFSQNNIDVM